MDNIENTVQTRKNRLWQDESTHKNKLVNGKLRFVIAALFIIYLDIIMILTHGQIPLEDLSTRLSGFDEDGGYSQQGTYGDYSFGPYYNYKKGIYTLKLQGVAEEANAVFFLSSDYGHSILLETPYIGDSEYQVDFENDESAVELIIKYNGEGRIRLDKVWLYKTNDTFFYLWLVVFNAVFLVLLLYYAIGKHRHIVICSLLLFVMVCNLLMAEYTMSGSVYQVATLITERPVFFLIGMIPFLLLGIIGLVLFNSYMTACLLALIPAWIMTLIEYNYKNTRGEVFALTEVFSAKDALSVMDKVHLAFPNMLLVLFALTIAFCVCFFLGTRQSRKRSNALLCGGLSIFIALAGVCYIDHVEKVIRIAGGDTGFTLIEKYYRDYGFFTGMFRTCPEPPEKPEGYGKERVESLLDTVSTTLTYEHLPNIIYLQVETLYDLKLVYDVDWSEDPLADLKKIGDIYTFGYMLSPVTGGGTANVEYEVLTGYPYENTGGTPFNNQTRPKMQSIASVLNDLGYETMAMHYNTGACYNRNNAYSNMGFERRVFLEDMDYNHNDIIGSWISDRFAIDRIIEDFEKRNNERPYFAHVVTVQNHGDYDRYDEHGITVGKSGRNAEQQRQLQSFLNMEKESCIQIIRLLDYFNSVDSPTVIVIWGDHCPWNNLFGIELNNNNINAHLTPLLIYSNYGLKRQNIGVIASYNLTPFLLSLLGIRTNDAYFNMMMDFNVPNVCNGNEVFGPNNIRSVSEWTEETEIVWQDLWLLQYDRQFGDRYSIMYKSG